MGITLGIMALGIFALGIMTLGILFWYPQSTYTPLSMQSKKLLLQLASILQELKSLDLKVA